MIGASVTGPWFGFAGDLCTEFVWGRLDAFRVNVLVLRVALAHEAVVVLWYGPRRQLG